MKYYLGTIKYRNNTKWFEINKLIKSDTRDEAEIKLKSWADKSVATKELLISVTETL